MILGTAGFTAGLALFRMEQNDQRPEHGPILVTGATGGVGMLAIDILSRAGYAVEALSGKPEQADALRALGATVVLDRHALQLGERPLETARWAGAIDNVGGALLSGLLRSIQPYGNIASCGMAGGSDIQGTVMPFIIRGVSLLGIASAGTARRVRESVWRNLAGPWKPAHLPRICTREVGLDALPEVFPGMLAGDSIGRTLVKL